MAKFMKDSDVVDRVLGHVKNKTTDRGETVWREPVDHYTSSERLARELAAFKSLPTPFSPSVALEKPGDYIARVTAGTPLIVTRGQDGKARAFKNACRHRGEVAVWAHLSVRIMAGHTGLRVSCAAFPMRTGFRT